MGVMVEFTGGLEYLFDGRKMIPLVVSTPLSIKQIIEILVSDHLKERRELFIADDTM